MESENPLQHQELAIFHAAMANGSIFRSEKKMRSIAHQVALLNRNGGPQSIDGVVFDFGNPLLNPREWGLDLISHAIMNIPGLGRFGPDGHDWNGPSIWFPWFGQFNLERYMKRVTQYKINNGNDEIAIRATIANNIPQYFVYKGDTVRIHSVEERDLNFCLEHSHDSTVNDVKIEILRMDGSIEIIDHTYTLVGQQALLSTSQDANQHLKKIISRIINSYGLKYTDRLSEVPNDGSVRWRAATLGAEVFEYYLQLNDRFEKMLVEGAEPESIEIVNNIIQGIDRATLLGFLWAKAEADTELKPLAKSALLRKKSNILGGSASGDARRKKAEIGWKAIARQMAFEVRSEHPDYSQDKVVKSIWLDWDPKTKVKCPESPTLKKFVSDLEKFEKLPPMRKSSAKRAFREAAE